MSPPVLGWASGDKVCGTKTGLFTPLGETHCVRQTRERTGRGTCRLSLEPRTPFVLFYWGLLTQVAGVTARPPCYSWLRNRMGS